MDFSITEEIKEEGSERSHSSRTQSPQNISQFSNNKNADKKMKDLLEKDLSEIAI
jgi:hypothetical protein